MRCIPRGLASARNGGRAWTRAAGHPLPLQLPAFHRGAVVTVRWTPLPPDAGDGPGRVTLSGLADGRTYTFRVRSRETVAGAAILSPPAETTTTIDATRPVGSVSIDRGAAHTNDLTVMLGFATADPPPAGGLASGVTRVQLSPSGPAFPCQAVSPACPSPFAALQAFSLTDGPDGPRTVWAAFHDAARSGVSRTGNVSEVAAATILLDRPPPTAVPAVPAAGTAGTAIALSGARSADGTGSDADSGVDPASHAWEFGDAGTGRGAEVSHAYAAPGTYSGRLSVADRAGNVGSATFTITIGAARPAPPGAPTWHACAACGTGSTGSTHGRWTSRPSPAASTCPPAIGAGSSARRTGSPPTRT